MVNLALIIVIRCWSECTVQPPCICENVSGKQVQWWWTIFG